MMLDIKTGGLKLLERQHDDAWIDGPGIRYDGPLGWLPDNRTIFFQSEESGFSHLYTLEITTGQKKALTSGNYEIYDLLLSNDKKSWYFISNEVDPGVRELYKLPVKGGSKIRLTSFEGGIEYVLSPDEKNFALRVSMQLPPGNFTQWKTRRRHYRLELPNRFCRIQVIQLEKSGNYTVQVSRRDACPCKVI